MDVAGEPHLGQHTQALTTVTIELPRDLTAPAIARRFVEENRDHLDPSLISDAQLLVTEIVTNAVRYGRDKITLAFSVESPGLGVAVGDAGRELPTVPTGSMPDLDRTGGRGMYIVDALATHWGVETDDRTEGKVVWFQLRP